MNDIVESMRRALVEQEWMFGDRAARLGSPFEWTENKNKANLLDLDGLYAVAFYFSMFYVQKETPPEMRVDELDRVREYCAVELGKAFAHFLPFLAGRKTWVHRVQSQALIRAQDYSFIRCHCRGLPEHVHHIDIGPGLGSSALYSLKFLSSTFTGSFSLLSDIL